MYPVAFEADYVEPRNRLTTFFRMILVIPWFFVGIFWGLAALVGSGLAWFAIVFTGRYPAGLYELVAKALRYYTHLNGFALLMTDEFPPFDGGAQPAYPVRAVIAPPLAGYSRAKTFFRLILMLPLLFVLYVVQLVSSAILILAWITIVLLGRLPRGLFDVMRFALAYQTRATAYQWLLTETYPPLTPDEGAPVAPPAAPPFAA